MKDEARQRLGVIISKGRYGGRKAAGAAQHLYRLSAGPRKWASDAAATVWEAFHVAVGLEP